MPALRKVETNRQNAQLSTGPVTEEGKQRSSRNATRHGFTGQTLVLTPEEQEAYEAHVASYFAQYEPSGHEETDLLQQYADLRWTLHQISVQQQNLMSLMNAITRQFAASDDPLAAAAALAPHTKSLNTLTIYEQRRRRAADDTLARFRGLSHNRKSAAQLALAQAASYYEMRKAKGQSFDPAAFGFVCSNREIEDFLSQQSREKDLEQELENHQEEVDEETGETEFD